METETRYMLERKFLENGMKVLVATVAYGMGIDKPDISFVIHFQKPGNVVAYYQQIGRAGGLIQRAYAILLVVLRTTSFQNISLKLAFPWRRT
jgi:ATP-dependent DNA helicase RecQ